MFPAGLSAQSVPPSQSKLSGEERDARARVLYEAAVVQYAEKDFESALELFGQAYEMSGRVQLLYNVGLAADRAGLPERARRAYRRYLAAQPDGDRAAEVTARLQELDQAAKVPSPREAALSASSAAPMNSPVSDSGQRTPLRRAWWLWTGVGVLVVGGVVAGMVATRGDDSAPLPETTTGLQVSALRGP